VHLVDFTIEIYYDARPYKRQICWDVGKISAVRHYPCWLAHLNPEIHISFLFDVLTSNISFIRVPNTEKCDVTVSNGTHQSANSRRNHMT
jgi:hypothetical protein